LIGLEHGALVGFAAGLIGFIPYVGSLLGVPAIFFTGQSLGDY
jgi:predicted PurR-regulated permease PerM